MKRAFPQLEGLLATIVLALGLSSSAGPGSGVSTGPAAATLQPIKVITGDIRPKSIGHSGTGRFFAQNMMYRHSITVYDRNFELIRTISDHIRFEDFGESRYQGQAQGAPVEIAFSPDGNTAWVSNYRMYGAGFSNPGADNCVLSPHYDPSFVYQIDTRSLEIQRIIKVGCVPKYLAATPDGKYLLVSNWCSGDLSVVDLMAGKEIRRLPIGAFPRGIAIDSKSRIAYVALMGEERIAVINLAEWTTSWIDGVGKTPRHLCLAPEDRFLYVTLSRSGEVVKLDVVRREIVKRQIVGQEARTMIPSTNFRFLYVVDHDGDQLVKIDAENLSILDRVPTREAPIGVTFDKETGNVWVSCYTGSILVFHDKDFDPVLPKSRTVQPANQLVTPHYPGSRDATAPAPSPRHFLYEEATPTGNIDMFQPRAGTARVSPAAPVSPSSEEIPANGRLRSNGSRVLYVVVASFTVESQAKSYRNRLVARGIDAEIVEVNGFYRISVGAYATEEAAKQMLERTKSTIEPNAWILRL